jgi:hypothetical protein
VAIAIQGIYALERVGVSHDLKLVGLGAHPQAGEGLVG